MLMFFFLKSSSCDSLLHSLYFLPRNKGFQNSQTVGQRCFAPKKFRRFVQNSLKIIYTESCVIFKWITCLLVFSLSVQLNKIWQKIRNCVTYGGSLFIKTPNQFNMQQKKRKNVKKS